MEMRGFTRVPSCEAVYNGERVTLGWTRFIWDKVWIEWDDGSGRKRTLEEGRYETCRRYYYEVAIPRYVDRAQIPDSPRSE